MSETKKMGFKSFSEKAGDDEASVMAAIGKLDGRSSEWKEEGFTSGDIVDHQDVVYPVEGEEGVTRIIVRTIRYPYVSVG